MNMCSQFRGILVTNTLFALLSITSVLPAQTSTDDVPTIKTKSNLVVVDVVARDHRGEPVEGLTASDFRVLEDGVAQHLTFFEEHKEPKFSKLKLPEMPANVFTNFPTVHTSDGIDVILVDCLNTEPKNQVSLRQNLVKFLKDSNLNSRVAIFTLGSKLRLVHGFSDDFSGLAMAINDKKSGATTEFSRLFPTAFEKDADKSVLAAMSANQASPEAIDALAQFQADETTRLSASRAAVTSQALQQLVRYVRRIPGRKNLIWFADTFPIELEAPVARKRDSRGHASPQDLAGMLSASQIAIYPISTQGLTIDTHYDSGIFNPDSPLQQNSDSASILEAMQNLAHATGGEAFFNTNDFSGSMKKASQDGAHYYTVAYTPADRGDLGKFRRITVEVNKCNCKLAYKQGYYRDSTEPVNSADGPDALVSMLQFGMPSFDQIIYKISVESPDAGRGLKQAPGSPSGRGTAYSVNFAISTGDVRLQRTADDVRHGELGIMMVIYSRSGKPLSVISRRFKLTIPPNDFKEFEKVGLQVHAEIEIPAGQSYLATGVYDYQAGTLGTLSIPISVSRRY